MQTKAAFVLVAPEKTIPLAEGSFVVGRGPGADIVFDLPQLSRRHVRLVVTAEAVDVEDLGSTNGTWVDAYLVQHRLSVKGTAKLKLGDLVLTLQPARGRVFRDPVLSTTLREGQLATSPPLQADVVTLQTSAFGHLRVTLSEMIEQQRFDIAKNALDPVLAELELSSRPLSTGALEAASEVALRLAIATRDASYVDAVVRIHQANDAVMADEIVTLLDDCITAGLEPDPRNAEEYLERLRGALADARAAKLARLEEALSGKGSALTAPAPPPEFKR